MTNKQGPEPTPKNPRQHFWLTINDILTELGIGRGTFDDWRGQGIAPRMKRLPNGTYRIRGDWFDEWLDESHALLSAGAARRGRHVAETM